MDGSIPFCSSSSSETCKPENGFGILDGVSRGIAHLAPHEQAHIHIS
jgi:hypothetical protein